jgi:ABC-type Mn2+/Zn2+ transport system permease subunit
MGIVLWVLLALWPAFIARRKGYSFVLFMIIALLISWLLALIIVLILRDKNKTAESIAADQAAEAALEKEEGLK